MEPIIDNKGNKKSLINFEKQLIDLGLLRIKPFMKKNIAKLQLKDFILKFINEYNEDKDKATFNILDLIKDSNCKAQCVPKARRSGSDIFRICKYYYPECSLEEVMKILHIMGDKELIRSSMCSMIRKRVYYIANGDPEVYNKGTKDEFNRVWGEYNNSPSNETPEDEDDFDN